MIPDEVPMGVIALAGNNGGEWFRCIVPLPGGDRVVIASNDGKVCVFAVATGSLECEFDAHKGSIGERALAALGGDIIVSGGLEDGNVVTWNAASGERLGEAEAGSGVLALAALDGGRFVAGTGGGEVVFYTHDGGRGVQEAARIAHAHSDWVTDLAECDGRLATASDEGTAAVWRVDTHGLLARLRGHTESVLSVDMNERVIATASVDKTVRVYDAEGDYSCTCVLDWLHASPVHSVALIGDDHLLSASGDYTVCVARFASRTVVARIGLSYQVKCTAALQDGRLAVCGNHGNAALIDAPAAAADILKAHGAAAIPEDAAAASVLAIAELLPPLQGAVVRVAAGALTAAAACHDLIAAYACSASLAECAAAHSLLMQAIRDGDIPRDRGFQNNGSHWLDNLYLPLRLQSEGLGRDDVKDVKRMLLQAESAGVIQSAEAMVGAIELHRDLKISSRELREARERMLRAIAQVLVPQAGTEQQLCYLEGSRRVQQWALLANTIFGLIPLAGASITCGIAGGLEVIDTLKIAKIVESSLSAIIGALPDAAEPLHKLFSRFLSTGSELLLEEKTAEENLMLEKIAEGLGVSMPSFQQNLQEFQRRMEERRNGGTSVAVERLAGTVIVKAVEDDDEANEKDNAKNGLASADSSQVGYVCSHFEGRTLHERLPVQNSSASENSSTPKVACDSAGAVCATVGGISDEQDVCREAVTFLLDVEECRTGAKRFATELNILRGRGVTVELVSQMDHCELAVSTAAHMVLYEHRRLPQFVKIRDCLVDTFLELSVSGSVLVGDHAIPADDFFDIVIEALTTSSLFKSLAGHRSTLRRFIDLVHVGNNQ